MTTETGTAVVPSEVPGLDRLQQKPIVDRIDARTLELIKAQVAKDCTDAEVGYFLELAAHYDLDPFAHEIWCVKNKGRLLIMVGRDGLRKIAQRSGLERQGSVIYSKDTFAVEFIDSPSAANQGEWDAHGRAPFHRITHAKNGIGDTRGTVAGAWARVVDHGNVERGYFDAPLSEYKPANANEHSPWVKQTSAMMLGAVERQALRQATPLAGLLVKGEEESAAAAWTGTEASGEAAGIELPPEAEAIIERAAALGYPPLADRGNVEITLGGRSPEVVSHWIAGARQELQDFENRQATETVEEATVVDAEPSPSLDAPPATAGDNAISPAGDQQSSPAAAEDSDLMQQMEASVQLDRWKKLLNQRDDPTLTPEARMQIDDEVEYVEGLIRDLGYGDRLEPSEGAER